MGHPELIPAWVFEVMLLPSFVLWVFWTRLVFQNWKIISHLKDTRQITSFSSLDYWSGKYVNLSPDLPGIRKRGKRLIVFLGLAVAWIFVVLFVSMFVQIQ